MLNQPIETIDEAALAELVINQVAERRDLEFKRDLPGRNDEQVKEFLADVTSIANAQGGDLIFGIADEEGVAVGLPGVAVENVDQEMLRLENIIRTSVDPRLIGVRLHWAGLQAGTGALIIRIPAGLSSPHRVVFKNSGRFYNRNSRGKYEMDVHELRHAFTQSEQLPNQFRRQHMQAIAASRGADMPFAIAAGPTAVVSTMPLTLFREFRDLPVTGNRALVPINARAYSDIDMIEGVVMHTPIDTETGAVDSYTVTHRSGHVDAAWSIGGVRKNDRGEDLKLVFAPDFEKGLLTATVGTQTRMRDLGIEGPWIVFASVYGARDFQMILGDRHATRRVFRDEALLGELRVDHIGEASLLPLLKNFWLLFGEHRPEGRPINDRRT